MIAINLHDFDEEVIGTVYLQDSSNYNSVCEKWDEYLKEYEGHEDIYQFEELYGEEDLFDVLNVDFYQPLKK